MKKFQIVFALFAFSMVSLYGQPGEEMPANAEPNKCYAKCLIPDQYETVTETIVVKPASSRTEIIPAVYETVTEDVVIKEASSQIVPISARYETVTERVLVKEASTRLVPVPAVYETVTERVMVKDASTKIEAVPAKYETVTERVLIKEASSTIARVPAKFETQSETVEVSPATTKWVKRKADASCLSADPDDCLVWCLIEVPAQYETVSKRVRIGCEEGYTDNGEDCTKEVPVEAEYGNRTFRKLVSPASTKVVEIPAQYETRTYQKLVSPATTKVEEIPAEYANRTYEKLVSPASTEVRDIPQEVDTRTYRKLVKPASVKTIEIPAETKTITKRQLVKKGGFSEWREVVCSADIDSVLTRQVQAALRSMGYDPGPVDNVMGPLTKAALVKFQRDKGLPVGQLNIETLEALGIDY